MSITTQMPAVAHNAAPHLRQIQVDDYDAIARLEAAQWAPQSSRADLAQPVAQQPALAAVG